MSVRLLEQRIGTSYFDNIDALTHLFDSEIRSVLVFPQPSYSDGEAACSTTFLLLHNIVAKRAQTNKEFLSFQAAPGSSTLQPPHPMYSDSCRAASHSSDFVLPSGAKLYCLDCVQAAAMTLFSSAKRSVQHFRVSVASLSLSIIELTTERCRI